jgi:hypothetical protein
MRSINSVLRSVGKNTLMEPEMTRNTPLHFLA